MNSPRSVHIVNLLPAVVTALTLIAAWHWVAVLQRPLLLIGLAVLFALALNPGVRWLERTLHLSRTWSVVLTVAGVLVAVVGLLALAVPVLGAQLEALVQRWPETRAGLNARLAGLLPEGFGSNDFVQRLTQALLDGGGALFQGLGGVLGQLGGVLTSVVFLFVLVVYTLLAPRPLVRAAMTLVPRVLRLRVRRAAARVRTNTGRWGRAQLLLMTAVGALNAVGFWLVGLDGALLYGLLAGLGEAIPTVGPLAAAVPPLVAALAQTPAQAGWVLLVALVAQQLENHVLVPLLLGGQLELHPVAVLASILLLSSAFGVLGAFLAVPALVVAKSGLEGWFARPTASHGDSGLRETR
jgi:predicted PurR-regulated permease PerM